MERFNATLEAINAVIWHDTVLFAVLAVGLLFTIWSKFGQAKALTHGVPVLGGKYDKSDDPGAITHFQALSAALSATVGLGNIGGVSLAISLGGPGAVFWMWVIGLVGMSVKMAEVTLSMLYRDTDDPENPRGGPMYVADRGFRALGRPKLGKFLGGAFVVTLLVSTITGGNMFQAWNVADVTHQYFGAPKVAVGVVLCIVVGMVIIGGIKRIGAVAGRLVPFMCGIYLVSALYVLIVHIEIIPEMLLLIIKSAFRSTEAEGAFLGGTAGYALMWGIKRALFSSEAGQGSSPIAHSAARTDEPVREGVVAGLEPFIDTLVVCTITSLVILSTGIWNRSADLEFVTAPTVIEEEGGRWTLTESEVRTDDGSLVREGASVFAVVRSAENPDTGTKSWRLSGALSAPRSTDQETRAIVEWEAIDSPSEMTLVSTGAYFDFKGATLTAQAFDRAASGLGKWLVTIAAWLFAISTMISWSYYGEQGVTYLIGQRMVLPFKVVYCLLAIVATIPSLIRTDVELDNLTSLGTGLMLWVNLPLLLIFGAGAMRAYHAYMARIGEE